MNTTHDKHKDPSRNLPDPSDEDRLFPAMWDLSSLPGQSVPSGGGRTNEHTEVRDQDSSEKTDAEVSTMLKGMQLDPFLDGNISSCNRRWPL